jgi:tetratricopeptide (TPR) repeat protein
VLARLYLSNHRPADARRVLRRALHYRPDEAALWELLAKSADGLGEEEEARRELARRFPEEPAHAIDLGAFLITRGRQDEARKLLEPLTRRGTPADRARAHYQLARSYYRRDELKAALEHIDQAFRVDPDALNTVKVHLLKGQINEELGHLATAARAYHDALAADREAEEALASLIRLALAVGNREQALDHLRRYTLLVGDESAGLLLAAHYYLRLGRHDEAFDLASRVRDEEFRTKAQRVLGLVAFHRGDWAGAVKHLQQGEQDADALEALVRAALRLGTLRDLPARLGKAAKVDSPTAALRRACELARRLLDRRAVLAREYPAPPGKEAEWSAALDSLVCAELARAEGDPRARVEALLQPAFAGGLELGPAYALRARVALDHGRLSRALADAERAVARGPKEPAGYYVRGRVRLERNAPGALDDLQTAARLSGGQDADVLQALAEALFRAGRRDEALAAQRAAVKLKPHDREMAEQLSAFEAGREK